MFSHWRCVVAAFGFVALATALGIGFQLANYSERYQPPTEQQKQVALNRISNIARIAPVLASIRDDQQSADSSERGRRDLNAQEGAARWTRWSAWASVIQLIVSAVGVGLVLSSLKQGQRGLRAALTGLRVSRQANIIQRDIGEAQTRAYLSVAAKSLKIDAEDWLDFAFVVSNSGQSPARNVCIHMEVFQRNVQELDTRAAQNDYMGDLAAGAVKSTAIDLDFTGPLRDAFEPQKFSMFEIKVIATYDTVFERIKGRDEFDFEAFAQDASKLSFRAKQLNRIMRLHKRSRGKMPKGDEPDRLATRAPPASPGASAT